MLFKRGSTISAAEGGCQAEVGGASAADSAADSSTDRAQSHARWRPQASLRAWAVRLRPSPSLVRRAEQSAPASPETVLQAAEIGIEHNLGLTCDPIDGLVQVPCIVSAFHCLCMSAR
jgi:hypothetical protein